VFELVRIVASTPSFHPLPSALLEELFNATFCYFPIRFKVAAHDSSSIPPQKLAFKLRDALFSSSAFAPLLFMGLSQRVTSEDEDDDVVSALQCLRESFSAFPAAALCESSDSLWGTLSHAAGKALWFCFLCAVVLTPCLCCSGLSKRPRCLSLQRNYNVGIVAAF
jgi:hypothetical protein